MVTAVGLTAATTCAAVRAGISRFKETDFLIGDEGITGATVPLGDPVTDEEKLLEMATRAAAECLNNAGELPPKLPIVLCLPELHRPGRIFESDRKFLVRLRRRLELPERSPISPGIVTSGSAGGAQALLDASEHLSEEHPACLVVGVDSYLTADTLTSYNEQRRLKTETHSDGFMPGEAAAAVLVRRPSDSEGSLVCLGIGQGTEPASIGSGEPFRAEGMSQAIRAAFATSGRTYEDVDFRIADVNGEQYGFRETSLALTRTMRVRKSVFPLWYPADCVGEIGAAWVPLVLGVALTATRRGYADGPGMICQFSSDGMERAAMVLVSNGRGSRDA